MPQILNAVALTDWWSHQCCESHVWKGLKSSCFRSSCVNSCQLQSTERLIMFLHASSLLSYLAFVVLTFVSVGLCVMASCVFSGTEDSYTVTCGMPLPCLTGAQKNNSGLYCLGKYKTSQIYINLSALPYKTVTQEPLRLVFLVFSWYVNRSKWQDFLILSSRSRKGGCSTH